MNKIITLDDIKNRPIDDLVQLYKYGYRIEEYNPATYNPVALQTCPEGCVPQSDADSSYRSGLYLGITLGAVWGIIAGAVISFLIAKRTVSTPVSTST